MTLEAFSIFAGEFISQRKSARLGRISPRPIPSSNKHATCTYEDAVKHGRERKYGADTTRTTVYIYGKGKSKLYFPPSGRISFGGRRPPGPLSQESLPVEEGGEGRKNLVLLRRHLLWRPPKVVLPRSQDPGPQGMRRRRRRKCPGKIFGAIILWRRENKWRGKKAQQFPFFVATISFDAFL